MSVLSVILGEICLLCASYLTSLSLIYLINKFTFMFPFDPYSYLFCPVSGTCVEYGYEYQRWVLIGTAIVFVVSGIIAPLLYIRREHA